MKKIKPNLKNALYIGTLCAVSYLAVYFARNIMSVASNSMINSGFDEGYPKLAGSFFFFFYAVGQLINGIVGDKVKAKYMLSFGLFLAGITNIIFAFVAVNDKELALFIYGLTGFFLAMIYGPMTKVVSENTDPIYTTRCSLGYTFASFFGSPLAGILAGFLAWQSVFTVGSVILFVMAICCFACFTVFERKGIVKYGQFKTEKNNGEKSSFIENVRLLAKHRFIKFSLIAIITGIIRTSVVALLPIYFKNHLGFTGEGEAEFIFSITTLIISASAFIAVFVYERLGHNMDKTILLMFILSAIFFACTFFINHPIVNIVFITLAIMAADSSSTMLWSNYCPSLRDTGMVSGATGFLDFLSYMAAAGSNAFSSMVSNWRILIAIWFGLMVIGIIISLPFDKMKKNN